ncbi:MAG: hypothetical protein AAGA72_16640, partial [Pseudomonadota bacterium]
MRFLILSTLCATLVSACAPETEAPVLEAETPPAPTTEEVIAVQAPAPTSQPTNVAERSTATIDWNAARSDFANRDTGDNVLAEVASSGSPVVPILLPEEPFGVASVGEDALQFRPTADGYFAVKKGDVYDLVINGTDQVLARPQGTDAATDTPLKYEETMTGALVSFSRYGAAYLVEFMCKEREAVIDGSCINEAEALVEVEKL